MNNLDLFWNWFNADCEDMGIQYTQTEQQTNNNILIKIVPTTMSSGLYQLNLFLKVIEFHLQLNAMGITSTLNLY